MYGKEILSAEASIGVDIIPTVTQTDDGDVPEYGLVVTLSHGGAEISRSTIPSVSSDRAFVSMLADRIVAERISPAYAADFIEKKLSE